MKVLLYDFRWLDEGTMEFQASAENKFGRKKVSIGDDISLNICSGTKCAGSRADDVWTACPNQAEGKARCDTCKARERNFVFTAFDGFDRSNVSELDLEQISGPHVVYLAFFDKNMIKIGVSQVSRKLLRQIEQGSHFTLYIAATPDGISARQIETLIRKDGLADKISASQKKNFICPEITKLEGETILREILSRHLKALDDYSHLKEFLLPDPEFKSWDNVYQLRNIEENPKHYHSVQLDEGEFVSGKIVAAKGPFIVLETPDELVSLCAKDLIGREIDFSPSEPGLQLHTALQNSLF